MGRIDRLSSVTRVGACLGPATAAPLGAVQTERLALRPFEPTDLDALTAVFAKPEVWQFPYGRAFTRSETEAFLTSQIEHWADCGYGLWLASLRATGAAIGYVGLAVPTFLPELLPTVEVGWRLDPDHWGRGFATEGARAALHEAFTTLGLAEVCSLPQSTNPPSARVCERIGMHFDRAIECPPTDRRGAVTAHLYRVTREQWAEASPPA
jgi:RimJ/RimL family protein N-acetyltransferase